jgi:glutaconyl-CoA/methylmalonyl-CoA decarboxylase subunit delta
MTNMLLFANAFADSLVHITGFFIVMAVLALMWGLCSATGWYFRSAAARAAVAAAKVAPSAPGAPPPAVTDGAIPAEEVAVIAAAVALLVGGRARIVSVQAGNADWSREGRRQIFASHKIR